MTDFLRAIRNLQKVENIIALVAGKSDPSVTVFLTEASKALQNANDRLYDLHKENRQKHLDSLSKVW